MANVVHVEDAVSVNSDGVVWVVAVGDAWPDHRVVVLRQAVGKALDTFLVKIVGGTNRLLGLSVLLRHRFLYY